MGKLSVSSVYDVAFAMSYMKFLGIDEFLEWKRSGRSGHLQIRCSSVTWNIGFSAGVVYYADRSDQSIKTVTACLSRDRSVDASVLRAIPTDYLGSRTHNERGAELNNEINQALHWLKRYLDKTQLHLLLETLTRDALESLAWLDRDNAHYRWMDEISERIFLEAVVNANVAIAIDKLLASIRANVQAWQGLNPFIASPYQRPVVSDPSFLTQSVAGNSISPQLRASLATLMRGLSFRQMAQLVKQDELKLAKLLYPYARQGSIRLQPALPPFNGVCAFSSEEASAPEPKADVTSASAPSQSKAAPLPRGLQAREKAYKVVCIDDSPVMLDTIRDYLGDSNCIVSTVEDPTQSLPELFKLRPNLILMDVSMPGINGHRLCQMLKKSSAFKSIPIVMVSGNHSKLDRVKAESMGASDFLAKPFTQAQLLELISKFVSVPEVRSPSASSA